MENQKLRMPRTSKDIFVVLRRYDITWAILRTYLKWMVTLMTTGTHWDSTLGDSVEHPIAKSEQKYCWGFHAKCLKWFIL